MDMRNLTVEVRDKALNRLGQIQLVDLDLLMEDQYNNIGSWTLNLRSDHPLADALCTPGAGIIVSDEDGVTVMSGPVTETDDKATIEDPNGTITIDGLTDTLVLGDKLAFPDPSNTNPDTQADAYDVRTGPAEDLMHAYVNANIGPSAPSARRIASLQMGTNGHRGSTVTKRARFDGLGNLVNDLALTSGLGFRVRQVGGNLEFGTFAVADRSADVRFDIYNNMLSGHSAQSAPPGVTRAIVGGDGSKLARPFVEVTTADSLAAETLWGRRIEQFIDQRSTTDPTELTQAGTTALADAGFAQTGIQIVPMEDIGVAGYGNTYTLGDWVTVVVKGVQYSVQVTGYVLKRNSDGYKFGLVLGNPNAANEASQVTARVTKLEGRVSNLERNAEGADPASIPSTLDDLTDTTITSPASGQVLQFDGTAWVNATPSTPTTTLAGATDVAITSPAARNILQWDATAGKWVNKTVAVLTAASSSTDVYALQQGSDTANRWAVKGDGATWWGPGNAAQDTNLYRLAAGILKTDGSLQLVDGKQVNVGGGPSNAAYASKRANTTDLLVASIVGTDAQPRLTVDAAGKHVWGSGSSTGDTNLYRLAASTLATDDSFKVREHFVLRGESDAKSVSVTSSTSATVSVSFATAFPSKPNMAVNINSGSGTTAQWHVRAINVTTTGFQIFVFTGGSVGTWTADVMWTASLST